MVRPLGERGLGVAFPGVFASGPSGRQMEAGSSSWFSTRGARRRTRTVGSPTSRAWPLGWITLVSPLRGVDPDDELAVVVVTNQPVTQAELGCVQSISTYSVVRACLVPCCFWVPMRRYRRDHGFSWSAFTTPSSHVAELATAGGDVHTSSRATAGVGRVAPVGRIRLRRCGRWKAGAGSSTRPSGRSRRCGSTAPPYWSPNPEDNDGTLRDFELRVELAGRGRSVSDIDPGWSLATKKLGSGLLTSGSAIRVLSGALSNHRCSPACDAPFFLNFGVCSSIC